MKTVIILVLGLFSFPLYALACKCNCDPLDNSICASQNEIEDPCPSVCSSPAPGMAPMFTACPVIKVVHLRTGRQTWVSTCNR